MPTRIQFALYVIQVAWAPPKVINEDKKLKEFWDVDSGAAYIPWGQMPSDMETLRSSSEASIDESSLPAAVLSAAAAEVDNTPATSQPGNSLTALQSNHPLQFIPPQAVENAYMY